MVIYEYLCLDCGSKYEKEGTYKELSEYVPKCPVCSSKNVRKIYYPVGIVFKGNGFYKTDNGEKNKESHV